MDNDFLCCRMISFDQKGKLVTESTCQPDGCQRTIHDLILRLPSLGEYKISRGFRQLGDDEIRLFVLCPGLDGSPVVGYLLHIRLAAAPAYHAVSWAWGDENDTEEITLDESPTSVPVNLVPALKAFRQLKDPLLLWVDTLCINQFNITERNHQVRLMVNIYASAATVLAWLGPATTDSVTGLAWLKNYLESGEVRQLTRSSQYRLHRGQGDMAERLWWSRMWVMQEVLLAQEAFLCVGKNRILWPKSDSWRFLRQNGTYGEFKDSVNTLLRLEALLGAYRNRPSILDVFALSQHRNCKDPRDRVFAILGLVDTRDAAANFADYTLTLSEVQRRLFESNVEMYLDLRTLSYAKGACSESTQSSSDRTWLPAWGNDHMISLGLDWTKTTALRQYVMLKSMARSSRRHKAAGLSIPVFDMRSGPSFDGFVFDHVRYPEQYAEDAFCAPAFYIGLGWTLDDWTRTLLIRPSDFLHIKDSNSDEMVLSKSNIEELCDKALAHMAEITTKSGRKGTSTRYCRPGDLVCILFGGNIPYILRKTTNDTNERYLFVGEAYIDGVMDGEMMHELEQGLHQIQTFELA